LVYKSVHVASSCLTILLSHYHPLQSTLQVHDVWYSFLVQKLTYSFGAKFEWRALELAPKSNWSIREPVLVRQVIGTLLSSLPVFGMNDAIVLMS